MDTKNTTHFLIALAFQIVVILLMIIFKSAIVAGGTDVFIKIEPIDPRDPFRGDYVTFNLEISRLDTYLIHTDYPSNRVPYPDTSEYVEPQYSVGQTVYVLLYDGNFNDQTSSVSAVSLTKPETSQVFIRGTIERITGDEIFVTYGIEEYFIPEGTGRNVSFWDREAVAHAKVDQNGEAVLIDLFIDGKQWP